MRNDRVKNMLLESNADVIVIEDHTLKNIVLTFTSFNFKGECRLMNLSEKQLLYQKIMRSIPGRFGKASVLSYGGCK